MYVVGRWFARSLQAAGWAPLGVFLLHVAASKAWGAYLAFPSLDIPMHILGGAAIAFFFHRSVGVATGLGLFGHPSHLASGLLVAACTCSASAFWEFAEWASDRYFGTHAQLGLDDTLLDMLLGMVGGALFLVSLLMSGRILGSADSPARSASWRSHT